MTAIFIRAIELEQKALALLVQDADTHPAPIFCRDISDFADVPSAPFAYWISDDIRRLFRTSESTGNGNRSAKQGIVTADDFRFVRLQWECNYDSLSEFWAPFAKGGSFSMYFADIHLRVNWRFNAAEIGALRKVGSDRPASRLQNTQFCFRPGLTWTNSTTLPLSVRVLPRGCVFGHMGPSVFSDGDDELIVLAIMNSRPYRFFVEMGLGLAGAGRKHYEVGLVQKTPMVDLGKPQARGLEKLAGHIWSLRFGINTHISTSNAFHLPALLLTAGEDFGSRAFSWLAKVNRSGSEFASIQSEIDDICFELYGISEEDRRSITEGFGSSSGTDDDTEPEDAADDSDDDAEDESAADVLALTAELVAWAVGVAVGRFDVRLATGEREAPPEPDPFDPLPVCSPGMLTGDDGLPVAAPPAGYPIAWPTDGVLVDDPGHPRDLVAAVRSVFDVVFGAESDAYWAEAASILDPRGHDLRTWLAKSFFEHHIKKHSKSRRKAPILWQLGVPSGKYSVWLYAHRVTGDRLFSVLNEILRPKLDQEESLLGRMKADAGASPTSGQRKEIEAQEDFVAELKTMIEEVARVAPLWAPDLDDGVVICLAPLWRLFPQHKPWQKECKRIWDKLAAGDFDWAHLAMHLWPERVVSKCRDDRSLAIAHRLEEVFWEQGDKEKWHKRKAPGPDANTKSWDDLISRLVSERTSRQIKDALSKQIAAGQAAGNTGTRKRGRARSK